MRPYICDQVIRKAGLNPSLEHATCSVAGILCLCVFLHKKIAVELQKEVQTSIFIFYLLY